MGIFRAAVNKVSAAHDGAILWFLHLVVIMVIPSDLNHFRADGFRRDKPQVVSSSDIADLYDRQMPRRDRC